MYFTDEEIRRDIIEALGWLKDTNYPEDELDQLADSATPVYYSDIIKDWQEMPSDFMDSWQEYGADTNQTILQLMQIDLYNYYRDTYTRIFSEVMEEERKLEEKESAENVSL